MIRQCAKCLIILGEKAPFSDKSITHTMCDSCLEEQMKEIEEMHRRRKVVGGER